MRGQFSFFQTPLDFSKRYWQMLTKLPGVVVDATCGGGHDTKFLADLLPDSSWSKLVAFDVQKEALQKAKKAVSLSKAEKKIEWILDGHEHIDSYILPKSASLIVYNLGYFPGGDKTFTTLTKTTIESVQKALDLLVAGGAISLTCYPGHEEGEKEEQALLEILKNLSPYSWSVTFHQFLNRAKSPSQLFIQKAKF